MQDAEARAGVVQLQATGYQRGQPPSETQRAARKDLTQDHRDGSCLQLDSELLVSGIVGRSFFFCL